MIDILKLYRDFRIDHREAGHKHCRTGWVQIECPFCSGNEGYHLGYCFDNQNKFAGAFVCWRCGGHNSYKVIRQILGLDRGKTKETVRKYTKSSSFKPSIETEVKILKRGFKFPSGAVELMDHHKKYLAKRRFDPDFLEKQYGLLSTGPFSSMKVGKGRDRKELSYKNRIIIPINWGGKTVSFQGRDVTNKHKLKYMACPEERELVNLKTILYGESNRKRCVLVEGVTDVWRLGFGALSTFGIKYRLSQVKCLCKFEQVFILFDPEPQARKQAEKIQAALRFRGVNADVLTGFDCDPGDMKDEDAKKLMKELGL